MANYVDDFQPARGDVTYGISPACSAYLSAWEQAWMAKTKSAIKQEADDAMENLEAAMGGSKTNRMDCYNNFYNIPNIASAPKQKAMTSLQGKITNAPNERMKAYAVGIQQSRYSPATVFDEDQAKLQREGYQSSNFTSSKTFFKDRHKTEQAIAQNRNYLAIRRACKFGIGLVATDPEFQGAKVHFILDGLDMTEVASKGTRSTPSTTGPNKVAVSITVSELRYVYRNWGKLSGKVILYVNLLPVAAPWVQDWGPLKCIGAFQDTRAQKGLWDAYGLARLNKYNVTDVDDIMKTLI